MKKTWMLMALFALLSFSSIEAKGVKLSLIGAVSKEVGPDHEIFNWGFSAGGDFFFYINDNILLGVRSTYSRFTPDETEFVESVEGLFEGDVSGDAFVVEIIPSLRLTTRYPMSMINLFAQIGAGVFILNNEVTVTGKTDEDGETSVIQEVFGEETRGRFGFNVGLGLTFGNPEFITVDLYPMFNLIFLGEGDSFRYFTINLALGFGI